MNRTIEDSKFKGLEICFSTLQNDPKNKYSKYAIFNGKDRNAKLEIGVEPGMVITTKIMINLDHNIIVMVLMHLGKMKLHSTQMPHSKVQ